MKSSPLYKYYIFLFFFLLPLELCCQVVISGKVTDSKARKAVPDVNVLLLTKDGKSFYAYTITGEEGRYKLSCNAKVDSMMLKVTGFNIKEQMRIIENKTQTVDLQVEEQVLTIREVTVKAEPIVRRSDTVNYYVANFIDSLDRSVGDVLKKMPGIEVRESGEIRYLGKSINKFYVEGLDLLKGRYGIGTRNIQAKDIATVQILENHQSVKALKDIDFSTDPAINLKLKESAKGTFNSVVQLGGGYKPIMWNGEVTTIFFGRKFQTLNTYKTNNTGEDVSGELKSFYGGLEATVSQLGILAPGAPAIDRQRYLNNNVHAVSVNTLNVLKHDYQLNINGAYLHDRQLSDASSVTTYYIKDSSPLVIREQSSASRKTRQVDLGIELTANTEKMYLKNNLVLEGSRNIDHGQILQSADTVLQDFSVPSAIRLRNTFNLVKPFSSLRFSCSSITDFSNSPSSLKVTPLLYPGIFGTDVQTARGSFQELDSRRFFTNNSASLYKKVRDWTFSLWGNANWQQERMTAMLSPLEENTKSTIAPDSLQNHLSWNKLDLFLSPGVTFRSSGKFRWDAGLYCSLNFRDITLKDFMKNAVLQQISRLYLDPRLNVNATLSNNLKISANAMTSHITGGLYEMYTGYIMTNYRTIQNRSGIISESRYSSCSVTLNYGNAILSLFGALDALYWVNHSNVLYGTEYSGSLSQLTTYAFDNTSRGVRTNASFGKRFDAIATTVTLKGGYNYSLRDILRQGTLMNTTYRTYNAGLEILSRIGESVVAEYSGTWYNSRSRIENSSQQLDPIQMITQKATAKFIITKKWSCNLSAEHSYNSSITSGDRNMFFLDIQTRYKTKRFDYTLEARNLLNTKNFNTASYSDVTAYIYSYTLRPFSVLLKVRFSIR
ncbi:MAG: hypothetical protein ACOXZJ_03890 [Bacteroidales bacterium]|jgi:hypothetical protein|nr:hypothetical protein [Acholeplasma sp.]